VRTNDGRTFTAEDAVICNVTPTQLYGRLLPDKELPQTVVREAAQYRYGRADMQIHLALDRPVDWPDKDLKNASSTRAARRKGNIFSGFNYRNCRRVRVAMPPGKPGLGGGSGFMVAQDLIG
jgi:phytoene dehydrogenase-like protein